MDSLIFDAVKAKFIEGFWGDYQQLGRAIRTIMAMELHLSIPLGDGYHVPSTAEERIKGLAWRWERLWWLARSFDKEFSEKCNAVAQALRNKEVELETLEPLLLEKFGEPPTSLRVVPWPNVRKKRGQ